MLAHLRSVAEARSPSVLSSRGVSRVDSGSHVSACVRTSVKKVRAVPVRRLSGRASSSPCSCASASALCSVHSHARLSRSRLSLASRGYMTSESSSGSGDKKSNLDSGSKSSSPAAPASASGKKLAGTSSTLSNLENLYAAFAKQQKEKAKVTEQKDVEKDSSRRPSTGRVSTQRHQTHASVKSGVMTSAHLQAAMEMDAEEDGLDYSPTFLDSLRASPEDLFGSGSLAPSARTSPASALSSRRPGSAPTPQALFEEKKETTTYAEERLAEQRSALDEMQQHVALFDGSQDAAKNTKRRQPKTLAELRAQEEELAIAQGKLDPMSPNALEMKKRNQPIVPRTENEAMMIETSLINRHRAAVEQVSHVEKELDISASVPGMAPLTHSQNPYLYNEAYQLGLTDAEATWLRTRENWKNLVTGKRTSLALQQRDMKEDRLMVDELFIKVVNRLSEGPESGTWIHPEDLKAQQQALAARQRLKDKLWDIYRHNPVQWAGLIHKYVPAVEEDKMAAHVMDPLFWSPTNPWLLTAFTRQLIDEARILEKMGGVQPLEEEIQARMVDQGQMRDDDVTDKLEVGPLGQSMGVSAEEEAEQRMEQAQASQNLGCLFCSVHRHRFPLDPMNVPLLARHMTSSGQILPRSATGLCKRHQAKMSKTIKQARHLNLFIYKHSDYRINNVFKAASQWTSPDVDKAVYTNPLAQAEKDPLEEQTDSFIDNMTRQRTTAEEEEAAYQSDRRVSPAYASLRKGSRTVGEDYESLVEQLNEEPVQPAVMSSIEALASKRTEMRSRQEKEKEEAGVAFSKASKETRRGATATFQKGARGSRSFAGVDSFDDENDEIGDSMVKSAVGKLSKAKFSARKMKDSL